MSLDIAMTWSSRLLGVSLLVQTAEYLALSKDWRFGGIWGWDLRRGDFFPQSLLPVFDKVFGDLGFTLLLTGRLLAALFLIFFPANSFFLMVATLSTFLIVWRFRGPFNGGSDTMTFLLAFGLWGLHDLGSKYAIIFSLYLGLQVTFSYFVAGVVKARQRTWWTGEALSQFLRSRRYIGPLKAEFFLNPKLCMAMSIFVILYELSFPLSFLEVRILSFYLLVGVIFHLMNYFIFGLNRFFFAWVATYPLLFALGSKS